MKTCPECGRPLTREPLTKTEAAVHRYVSRYVKKHGYSPSHREVCDHFGWRSLATTNEYLGRLVGKGWLARAAYNESRAYVPIPEGCE